jgi:hypothetical protein
MTPRREVINFRSHELSPHVVDVAIILRWKNYFQYAHKPRPISQLRLKQQLVGLRNSIRHCMGVSRRLVVRVIAYATRLRTRFDCSIVRCSSWPANQNHDGLGGQCQLRKEISVSLCSANASWSVRAASSRADGSPIASTAANARPISTSPADASHRRARSSRSMAPGSNKPRKGRAA